MNPNELDAFMSLSEAISSGEAPDVPGASKRSVDGIDISTKNTVDNGYETALIDANKVYIVANYETQEEAVEGHNFWTEFVKSGKRSITDIGYRNVVDPTDAILVPKEQ